MTTDKSNTEIWLAEKFAEAMNRDFATDYVAEKATAERDSADAFLVSIIQGCRIGLQLCMATTTERMREEGVQDKLQRRISDTLMKQGVSDCIIMVVPRRMPEKADIDAWHDGVVKLVLAHSSNLQAKIELEDGDSPSVFGDLPFSSLTIHKNVLQEKWNPHSAYRG